MPPIPILETSRSVLPNRTVFISPNLIVFIGVDLCGYWLPTPSLSLLHNIAQAWEGEMRAEHQSVLSCRPFKKLLSIVHSLFRRRVAGPAPLMLYHYGVDDGIGQV